MNIDIALEEFCHHSLYIKGVLPYTISRYRQNIGLLKRSLSITTLDQITEQNIKEYFIYGRIQRQWKPETYRTYYMTFTVFFRWCRNQGYMNEDIIKGIELPKLPKNLPKSLKKQDALTLLEIVYNYPYTHHFLRYRNHAMFSTFLFCGLRKSELLNLTLSDVDIENLTVLVRQGKGAKDRIVPMNYTLAQSLERYVIERKKQRKTCPHFFTSLNRNAGYTEHGLKHLVKLIRKASGIDFTIHKLRHTFATLMLEGGCDIFSLSKMMGHSDIKTTTIYLSTTAEHLRSQINKHPFSDVRM